MQYAHDEEQGKVTVADVVYVRPKHGISVFADTSSVARNVSILHNSDPTLSKKESGSLDVDSRKRGNILVDQSG